jgi:hypothetical protein
MNHLGFLEMIGYLYMDASAKVGQAHQKRLGSPFHFGSRKQAPHILDSLRWDLQI